MGELAKNGEESKDFSVVGVGASAGGIEALKKFFAGTPADPGMAFVVIIHLSEEHESHLAEILQTSAKIPVRQVTETVKVEPNRVYVVPPAKGLEMVDGTIRLTEPERGKAKRLPIDLFFRSLADAYGRSAVCVILSGSGSDGTLGLKRVKERGGLTVAQSPDDAEYDSMPRSAIATNLVDVVLPANEIPEKIIGVQRLAYKQSFAEDEEEPPQLKSIGNENEDALREILTILRIRTGHDFSNYKRPTLLRRIARRLQVHDVEELPGYVGLLRDNADEAQSLLSDLLITVTNFFRDKEAFEALEKKVVPRLFEGKTSADHVRAWTVGCATGEEAFSVAILLHEYVTKMTDAPTIQVFASDINEDAIATARECVYDEAIAVDVSPERLKRFFAKESSRFRVKKEIRERVLFAPHDVLRDPPFFKLDLITCRNLLIYLNRETQKRVLEIFHFALKQDGILLLGASESHETAPLLFAPLDKKQRIFKNSPSLTGHKTMPTMPTIGGWNVALPEHEIARPHKDQRSYGEIHVRLVQQFAAPSVLVSENYEIVHISEAAGRFLRVAAGTPTRDLLKAVQPSLKLDLQSALLESKQKRGVSESRNVRFRLENEKEILVNITVHFIEKPESIRGFYLVMFDESKTTAATLKRGEIAANIAGREAMEGMIRNLEAELANSKSRLRAMVEEHEASGEELKASNEELQAINEELRSASEELETSREELQSLNEELTTVNQELRERVREGQKVNADLNNLIQSTDIGTIFLDRNLRIKRFTPRVEEVFNIVPADVGRPLDHVTHRLDYDDLAKDAAEVLKTLHLVEREARGGSDDGRYLVRLAPYRTLEDKIDGVVLSFQDITDLKRTADLFEESEARFSAIVRQTTAGMVQTDLDGKILIVNQRFCDIIGYSCDELLKMRWPDLIYEEDAPRAAELFAGAAKGKPYATEKRFVRKDGSPVWVHNIVNPILNRLGKPKYVLAVTLDITERKQIEKDLRASEEKFRILSEAAPALIWFDDAEGNCLYVNKQYLDFYGKTEDELEGKGWHLFLHPDDAEDYINEFRAAQRERRSFHQRVRALRHDGEWRWLESFARPLLSTDGAFLGHVGVSPDITELVNAEKIARDKETLQRLVNAQEDERRRVARDLHDQLGQDLTGLNLKLALLKDECGDQTELRRKIEELEQIGRSLDTEVDFLVWELRPPALDDIGLAAAVTNFTRNWSKVFDVSAEVLTKGFGDETRLAPDVDISLYRIAQEALNNIAKHAAAKKVSVVLDNRSDVTSLIVEDDGRGFDVEEAFVAEAQGLGLVGMRERAALVGGNVEIESAVGKGTTVFVRVPKPSVPERSTKRVA